MQSPKFDQRARELFPLFGASKLKKIWETKIRIDMRKQHILDPIDYLDFHLMRDVECASIENLIKSGNYKPNDSRRVLVEKSKGLCRQIVVPKIHDAIILQCLSDALYNDIKGKAPTKKAFFEQEDHAFNEKKAIFEEPEYGSFKSWLNFQKAIFKFSEEKEYLIVTDIANYYDGIIYSHLRNIISGIIDVRESVLDMLIFVLGGMLWQPDYMPRSEIGLPQINLEAPRILAHCFLYELDKFLDEKKVNFVRFMDDIDVGVDTIQQAKIILKSIDLMLQTRHVRLNSGKTNILNKQQAIKHFCIRENRIINFAEDRINKKVSLGKSLDRERAYIKSAIVNLNAAKRFDQGNGEKILKRLLGIASKIGIELSKKTIDDILIRRPASRKSLMRAISRLPLNILRANALSSFCKSAHIVDDGTWFDLAYLLVETPVIQKSHSEIAIKSIIKTIPHNTSLNLYAKIWLMSKYSSTEKIIEILRETKHIWQRDYWLGRLIGSLEPIFFKTSSASDLHSMIINSNNTDAMATYEFLISVKTDKDMFDRIYNYIKAPNKSIRLGIKHSKFFILASAIRNKKADPKKISNLKNVHTPAICDIYYKSILQRTSGDKTWTSPPMPVYPVL